MSFERFETPMARSRTDSFPLKPRYSVESSQKQRSLSEENNLGFNSSSIDTSELTKSVKMYVIFIFVLYCINECIL